MAPAGHCQTEVAEPGPEPFVCHNDLNHCDLEPHPWALELGFAEGVSWPVPPPPTFGCVSMVSDG